MPRGAKTTFAVMAVLVFVAGVFLLGVGSGYVLADFRVRSSSGAREAPVMPVPSTTPPHQGIASPEPAASATPVPSPTPATALMPSPTVEAEADVPDPSADQLGGDDPLHVLREVWDIVHAEYYGDVPDGQTLGYAAVRGLLGALDDEDTTFIEPRSAAIIDQDASGEFEGIGAFVGVDDDGALEIIEPFVGGPADKAGLLAGDRVLAVDGTPLAGKSLDEAISLIRGPAQSQVTLLIERPGLSSPFEAVVTRARIEVPTTSVRITDEGIGYLRLHTFNASASQRMEDDLKALLGESPQGLILDLRQNPGGWLDQAIAVADLFLREGVIVMERWSDGSEEVYESVPGDLGENIPLVVLVDRTSASASEIVAGALQHHSRAVLVGEPTYGKGSVQRPHSLSDGSELRVTVALWLTPDGTAIHERGLTPDIEVGWPEDTVTDVDTDPQLERAVQYLLTGE